MFHCWLPTTTRADLSLIPPFLPPFHSNCPRRCIPFLPHLLFQPTRFLLILIHPFIIFHNKNRYLKNAHIFLSLNKDCFNVLEKSRRKLSKQSLELSGNWLLLNYVVINYSVMENILIMYFLVDYDAIYSWKNVYVTKYITKYFIMTHFSSYYSDRINHHMYYSSTLECIRILWQSMVPIR